MQTTLLRRLFHRGCILSESKRISGTVKWFDRRKGFGFITPNPSASNAEDVFVHQTSINSASGYRMLLEGQEVSFESRPDHKGRIQAYDVTQPDGSPIKPMSQKK